MINHLLNKIKFQENYIIILLVGFLISSVIPTILGGSFNINILYRLFVALISFFFILNNFLRKKIPKRFSLLLVFFSLYSIRLVYDLYFKNGTILWIDKTASNYFQLFFGMILIPCIALMYIDYKKLDYDYIFKRLYTILFLLLCISLIFRSGSDVGGRSVGDLEIGVLLYGQYGTTFSLLSLYRLYHSKGTLNKLFSVFGYFIGFITIFISASRSPLLALLLVTLFFLYKRFGKARTIGIVSIISIFIYVTFFDIVDFLNIYFKSNFLDRIVYAMKGVDSGRGNLIGTGIKEFIDNPFIGNAFLLQSGPSAGIYPHNLIVEAFMALGVIGGFIFIVVVVKNLIKSFNFDYLNSTNSWLGLLFLQYLIFGMFSGSLYTSDLFCVLCVIILGINNKNKVIL